jgi:hypothetical protein
MLYTVVVGGGLKLFSDNLELKNFELKKSITLDNGVFILEFQLMK